MFKLFLISGILVFSSGFAIHIDPNASSFSEKSKKRVDQYDFQGEYLTLKDIDIDAKRKMHVELLLNGHYPLLEKISFVGGFGTIMGDLTGAFPTLKKISLVCTAADLDLNLDGEWESVCEIEICCKGPISIQLPKEAGCQIILNSSPFAKIINEHPTLEQKKRKLSKLLQRTFATPKIEGKERLLKLVITSDRETVTFR